MKIKVHSVPKKLLEASDILFGVSRIGLALGLLTLKAYPSVAASDESYKPISFLPNILLNHGVYLAQLI